MWNCGTRPNPAGRRGGCHQTNSTQRQPAANSGHIIKV
nr:MAG TPA: hypothetical protein [Caudoviricetes sp.]